MKISTEEDLAQGHGGTGEEEKTTEFHGEV